MADPTKRPDPDEDKVPAHPRERGPASSDDRVRDERSTTDDRGRVPTPSQSRDMDQPGMDPDLDNDQ